MKKYRIRKNSPLDVARIVVLASLIGLAYASIVIGVGVLIK